MINHLIGQGSSRRSRQICNILIACSSILNQVNIIGPCRLILLPKDGESAPISRQRRYTLHASHLPGWGPRPTVRLRAQERPPIGEDWVIVVGVVRISGHNIIKFMIIYIKCVLQLNKSANSFCFPLRFTLLTPRSSIISLEKVCIKVTRDMTFFFFFWQYFK